MSENGNTDREHAAPTQFSQKGITESLGEQVTGIVTPVSLCMALTVALVRVLNPDGDSGTSAVAIATAFYREQEDDTTGEKLAGSVVNALIFISVIGGMTFVLFLLFKYKCYKFIFAYMGFAGFNIFFFLTGTLLIKLWQTFHLPLDAISFCYVIYNFAVVGMLSLFFLPVPITMKQGYLIVTGVVVAYIFTLVPEWTTWVMLVAMALYDLCAVLIPGGPLKVLVDLAIERNEEIPALVYESRPVRPGVAPGQWSSRRRAGNRQPEPAAENSEVPAHGSPRPLPADLRPLRMKCAWKRLPSPSPGSLSAERLAKPPNPSQQAAGVGAALCCDAAGVMISRCGWFGTRIASVSFRSLPAPPASLARSESRALHSLHCHSRPQSPHWQGLVVLRWR
uniref:Presenilin n=1 Tax=Tetraselmis sp. GSL018 TaxID=582737 RepID=A0A061R1G5_9CHLO